MLLITIEDPFRYSDEQIISLSDKWFSVVLLAHENTSLYYIIIFLGEIRVKLIEINVFVLNVGVFFSIWLLVERNGAE